MKTIPVHTTAKGIIAKRIEDGCELNFDGIHRHNFYEILFFTGCPPGSTHHIDFEESTLRTDSIYILKPGQVYTMGLTSHEGFLIAIQPEYLRTSGLLFESRIEALFPSILELRPEDRDNIGTVIRMLYGEYFGENRPELVVAHANTLLSYLGALIRKKNAANGINSRMGSLLELIENNYMREHDVGFYAAALSLGKKRLNVLAAAGFGLTVKQLLGQRLLLQSKRMISGSHSTFKEIASELGFKDASYFSRFFRRNSGMTPEEFRRSFSRKS